MGINGGAEVCMCNFASRRNFCGENFFENMFSRELFFADRGKNPQKLEPTKMPQGICDDRKFFHLLVFY